MKPEAIALQLVTQIEKGGEPADAPALVFIVIESAQERSICEPDHHIRADVRGFGRFSLNGLGLKRWLDDILWCCEN